MANDKYLYFSTTPEALVASMLPPHEFGTYLAVGTKKRSRAPAMYFDLKPGFESDFFDLSRLETECVPHPDGTPKRSLYLGIYRVLEHIPLEALNDLYLVTCDGRTLQLQQETVPEETSGEYHIYDEICPVQPLVASNLNPQEFVRFITDPEQSLHVPRICFAEIDMPHITDDPARADLSRVGYQQPEHLRDCLLTLGEKGKHTKTVDRLHVGGGWRRRFKNGFFVGDQTGMVFYRFPSAEELESKHHAWYRSASV